MKSKSLKINIVFDFIISGIQSFFITFIIFIMFFGSLHIISYKNYCAYIQAYNSSNTVMAMSMLCLFFIFIICFFVLFMRRMNKVTDYINEICKNLEYVSKGNMKIDIPVKRKDEVGTLALSVNKMAYDLNELIEKERAWDKQKNNLITNLSHDLRTPLTSILGFLKLISDENYNGDNLKHYLEIILNKAESLKKSIDQLFEFSKINNYDYKISKQIISVNELVKQMLVGFTLQFEENNMQYRITEENKDIKINADPYLLMRAFENIVTNTIKYAKDGKYLDIFINKNDGRVKINFVNYGPKIEEEDINNIFDRFYRIENTCKKQDGTGLGMTIVKTVIKLHSGSINVNSTNEKTEFEFCIPL